VHGGHLSTQVGADLYPLTGMVLIYHWNNSACLALECNHTLVCINVLYVLERRQYVIVVSNCIKRICAVYQTTLSWYGVLQANSPPPLFHQKPPDTPSRAGNSHLSLGTRTSTPTTLTMTITEPYSTTCYYTISTIHNSLRLVNVVSQYLNEKGD